jgi:hypothetical protein
MAVGFPTKVNYATGDVLSATNMNDLSGTVNSLDGTQKAAGKNVILNSNFSVWQRGTTGATVTSAVKTYGADRWWYMVNATGSVTMSRQATGDTTNLPNIQYCARLQRTAGNTALGAMSMQQPVDTVNAIPFAGKTVILSFYARRGANYSEAFNNLSVAAYSGTGTDESQYGGYTGQATVLSPTSAALTTTWQRFQFSFTIGATATEFCPVFYYTPTGTAGANDYFDITGVQIEASTVISAYASNCPTYATELAACQRYFWRAVSGTGAYIAAAQNYSTSTALGVIQYPVPMRTTPAVTVSSAAHFSQTDATAGARVLSAFSADSFTTSTARLTTTCGVFMIAGNATLINSTNASATLDFGAEL